MNDIMQKITESFATICAATDKALNAWTGEGNYKIPDLIQTIALELDWNEKQIRENDPIVRFFIRNNPNWYVTRGAHGGVMRASDKQKKEAEKQLKQNLKAQVKAAIEAKVSSDSDSEPDQSSSIEDEDNNPFGLDNLE